MSETRIDIQIHPPERRRRTETLMCGCCCCCCCCLHTVGGIIGSAVAPAFGKKDRLPIYYYYDEELDAEVPAIQTPGISAVRLYWILSLAFALIGALLGVLGGGEGFVIGLVILAMVYPAVQLAGVIVTLIVLAASNRPDKSRQLWQLGKITLGLFVGTAAGIMAMVAIGVMLG